MSSQVHKINFTYEDYLLFPQDGKRHEIINGDPYVTPSPSTKHQKISGNLLYFFKDFLRRTKAGYVFDAPMDVILSDLDVVQPDLLFISSSRSSMITEKNVQGALDLVVEIISETSRKIDELIKRKLYEQHGVSEYWIVDPELETVKVYRMSDRGYIRAAEISNEPNAILLTPSLPDFQIQLSSLFE
ncbi:MAG: Uma2 family endonuclease [Candidatus Manganitrophaceae bacterium]